MNISEVKSLKILLEELSPTLIKYYDVYVDNLKQPFIILPESYKLPSVPHTGINYNCAKEFLKGIAPHFSPHLRDFYVMPNSRPKRDSGKLMLVKDFSIENNIFLYVIKFESTYLGGAKKEDKILEGTQEFSTSILTNRVYFSASIFPVQELVKQEGFIIDFVVPSYTPIYYDTEMSINKKKFFSELFDEIDYSPMIDTIKNRLELPNHWKLGKIYEPIFIEYLSMCIRFLSFNIQDNIQNFSKFHKILTNVVQREDTIHLESIQFFHKWLEMFSFERSRTISGNMAWKILFD
jgi:hypothetical protein